MFLSSLTNTQANLFLDLAIYSCNSDNEYSKDEETLLFSICNEMGIIYRNVPQKTFDEALQELSNLSDKRTKKKMLLEMVGITMIDKTLSNEEKEILVEMVSKFELENELEKLFDICKRISAIYKEINDYVLE